jgi:hypothetical protein
MYTARTLLRKVKDVEVDMIEMLPTPFGLVRYGGVAKMDSLENEKGTEEGGWEGGERKQGSM